jgi:hypothetical protein
MQIPKLESKKFSILCTFKGLLLESAGREGGGEEEVGMQHTSTSPFMSVVAFTNYAKTTL